MGCPSTAWPQLAICAPQGCPFASFLHQTPRFLEPSSPTAVHLQDAGEVSQELRPHTQPGDMRSEAALALPADPPLAHASTGAPQPSLGKAWERKTVSHVGQAGFHSQLAWEVWPYTAGVPWYSKGEAHGSGSGCSAQKCPPPRQGQEWRGLLCPVLPGAERPRSKASNTNTRST